MSNYEQYPGYDPQQYPGYDASASYDQSSAQYDPSTTYDSNQYAYDQSSQQYYDPSQYGYDASGYYDPSYSASNSYAPAGGAATYSGAAQSYAPPTVTTANAAAYPAGYVPTEASVAVATAAAPVDSLLDKTSSSLHPQLQQPPPPAGIGLPLQNKKKKALLRAAGGEAWEDPTLTEWDSSDFRLFCGDLGNEVTDELLHKTFSKYPSLLRARVVRDKKTMKSKGYGFVSFKDATDFVKAMKEMNGKYVGNRPIKLRKSTWKDRTVDYKTLKHMQQTAVIKPVLKTRK